MPEINDAEVRGIINPVIDWYQPDDQHRRPLSDILRDIVADLQEDRRASLEAIAACRKFLSACRCVDIHHHGFGPAFDAAQTAVKNATTWAATLPPSPSSSAAATAPRSTSAPPCRLGPSAPSDTR